MDDKGAKIIQMPNRQVEIVDPIEDRQAPSSPPPSLREEAEAAIVEGDHILERLSEDYITIGAGDPDAEVIRLLVANLDTFAGIAIGTLGDLGRYAGGRLADIG